MSNVTKSVIGVLELAISLLFLTFYLKSMLGIIDCSPKLSDCGGYGSYNTITYWPFGLVLLISSIIFLKTKSWYSQLLVIFGFIWILWREFIYI
jgi:hypothetical protein